MNIDEASELAKYTNLYNEYNYLERTLKANTQEDYEKQANKLLEMKKELNSLRESLQKEGILSQTFEEDLAEKVGEEVVRRIAGNLKFSKDINEHDKEQQRKIVENIINDNMDNYKRAQTIEEILSIVRNEEYKLKKKRVSDGWKKVKEIKTRTTDVRIRMTLDEKEHMQENAEKYGYNNLSEYIRQVALSNPKKNPAAATIYKYELSEDKLGLKAFFKSDNPIPDSSFYHIHSTEMTDDQRIIHELLLMRRINELESLANANVN